MAKRTYTYDGSDWVGLTSTTADLSNYANMTNTPISGFRNAIINGDFRIWQRGTSFTPSSNLIYTADRFFGYNSGNGSMTVSRQSFTPGNAISGYESEYYLRTVVASLGTSTLFNLGQRIEDVRTLAGQTMTVSFWMKSDANRTVTGFAYQVFGSGGSSATTTQYGTFNVTTSWQRFTATVTLPSILGKTVNANSYLSIELNLPAAIQTTEIWGLQVEPGSIATPFEQRPIGTELALCHRYYSSSISNDLNSFHYGYFASPNSGFNEGISVPFPTRMRIVPTVTVSFTSVDNAINGGQFVTADGFNQYFRCSNGGYPYAGWRASYTASAEI